MEFYRNSTYDGSCVWGTTGEGQSSEGLQAGTWKPIPIASSTVGGYHTKRCVLSHDGRQASNCYAFSMLLLLLLRLWLRNLYVFPLCGVELKGNMYVWLILWPPPPWRGLFRSIFPDHVPNGCGNKKFVFVLMQFRDRTTPMACNFLLQGLCVWQGNRFPPTARSHHVGSCWYTNMQRIHHSRSREPRLPVLSFLFRLMHDFQVLQGRVSSKIITCTSG